MYKQRWLEQYKQRLKKKTAIQTLATLFGNQSSSRLILTCLHYFNQLQTFVHILACGKETLKHKNLEVIVHVAVDTTHYLEAKQSNIKRTNKLKTPRNWWQACYLGLSWVRFSRRVLVFQKSENSKHSRKNLSAQSIELKTHSTHIWTKVLESISVAPSLTPHWLKVGALKKLRHHFCSLNEPRKYRHKLMTALKNYKTDLVGLP